jgi:hypothetical protein
MWTSILCAWDQTLSAKGSFWFFPGSFYQPVLYFSHAGASKTEEMQMHFKFHIPNKCRIINDNFTYEAHMLLKLNELQKSCTESHIAQLIITANKVIQVILSQWFYVCCVHYKGTSGAWL